jgi:rhodanese-related sulfurtransferase
MEEISPKQLAQWRKSGKDLVLLDVREPDELAHASLPDAVHIPMREIPVRFHELDPARVIAVLCHHGGRSERVANFLTLQGYEQVYNVDGGIEAYARDVDASIPRY